MQVARWQGSAEAHVKVTFAFLLVNAITPLPARADTMSLSVGTLILDKVPNQVTRGCVYLDDSGSGKEVVHYRFPLDVRCPARVPLHENATLDPLPGNPYILTPGQKNHICGYYIDNDRLRSWHLQHPNDPNPLFEAVVPDTTRCPEPADDSTLMDGETPAQRTEIYGKRLIIDCDDERRGALDVTCSP